MKPKQKEIFQGVLKVLVPVSLFISGAVVSFSSIEMPSVEVDYSMTREFISTPVEETVEEPVESIQEGSTPVEEIELVEEPDIVYEGVLVPSNLTAEELEKGLLYDLKQYSEVLIQAEKDTGINAVFLSAVAALESGWATSDVSKTSNNLFGWTSNSGYRSFDSKEECILYVADKIKKLYLTKDGVYFNGYEVSDINIKYNGRKHWEDNVTAIMSQIQDRIEEGNNARVND